jgi:hypothetical protein
MGAWVIEFEVRGVYNVEEGLLRREKEKSEEATLESGAPSKGTSKAKATARAKANPC